ncbi:hypothetical protein ZIOFF_050314 [Zingiber officinale]|uniref:Uncharacterized protein n=2 Tax=Zingiber officinale TaxID=94328 RepID=A0A8J5FRF8_ZINOF|nr:hypothetical protein ZIOFF_050314 [Zingiber officinale]
MQWRTTIIIAMADGCGMPPGKPMSAEKTVIDKGAEMLQSLKPVKHFKQQFCSFALFSHDPIRQIETHHFCSRLNHDFHQCAVYNSDSTSAQLIGVEYVISESLFKTLSPEERKLWHSHAHEVKTGLLAWPRVPESLCRKEIAEFAKTYGKFWCTWQVDRGDRLPMGPPALMASPQGVNLGWVRPDLVKKRDDRYGISAEELREKRADIEEPDTIEGSNADYWVKCGKGFSVDVVETAMNLRAPFP